MFGFNTVSLDQKGRLAIPAKYRAHLLQNNETKIVVTKDPQYPSLKIYPESEWEIISSKLQSLQGLDPIVRNLQWTILGNANVIDLDYYDSYRSERLPQNLLQAQRDYFGAHTYERTDEARGKFFHLDWLHPNRPELQV